MAEERKEFLKKPGSGGTLENFSSWAEGGAGQGENHRRGGPAEPLRPNTHLGCKLVGAQTETLHQGQRPSLFPHPSRLPPKGIQQLWPSTHLTSRTSSHLGRARPRPNLPFRGDSPRSHVPHFLKKFIVFFFFFRKFPGPGISNPSELQRWQRWILNPLHHSRNSLLYPTFVHTPLFCVFLGPHTRHMEVPRLGVKSEL